MSRLLFSCLLVIFSAVPASAWWEEGHRATARLAAYYLTPAARTRIAAILGVPDTPEAVADGLAVASTWADEIKKDRPETFTWHFIDITLQDKREQIPARCPDQNCVTARIDQFSAQLVKDKAAADARVDLNALRFLVHFVGDIHQPLHAVSDADQGGNCELLEEPYKKARNLHSLWDGPMVSDVNQDDRTLAADLKKDLDGMDEGHLKKMADGSADDWAWESHKLSQKVIYKRLKIPTEPVEFPANCKAAPQQILDDKIAVDPKYVNDMKAVVRLQLERAGVRLARLLNEVA